jgi:multidrug efflux pump subunit AcrA (membrane-fusion protein)
MKSTITAGLFAFLLLASAFAQTGNDHSIRVNGSIQPAAQWDVKSGIDGRIKKLQVRPGDQVKAGDLLIEIDNSLVEDNSKLKVLAPVGGTILTLPVVERQVVIPDGVSSSTTLMTIANLSKLVIDAHVPQANVTKLTSKQAVLFTADSIRGEQMEATICFIAPVATVKTSVKGFLVKAIIEKPDPRLHPGMTAQLIIPISTSTSK